MKSKQKLIGIIAIAAIIAAGLTSCPEGEKKCECGSDCLTYTDETCNCGGKDCGCKGAIDRCGEDWHYTGEECNDPNCESPAYQKCEHEDSDEYLYTAEADDKGSGCEDPACKQTAYYGVLNTLKNTIRIYKGEGVSDDEALTAVQNVKDGYAALILDEANKNNFEGKVEKITIIADPNYTWNATSKIFGIKFDRSVETIQGRFELIISGELNEVSQIKQPANGNAVVTDTFFHSVANTNIRYMWG